MEKSYLQPPQPPQNKQKNKPKAHQGSKNSFRHKLSKHGGKASDHMLTPPLRWLYISTLSTDKTEESDYSYGPCSEHLMLCRELQAPS